MNQTELFDMALGLSAPWFVRDVEFEAKQGELHLHLDFRSGSRFPCPTCGEADRPVRDTEKRTWRHLNFFQHRTLLHARVPRTNCDGCGVKQVEVPWSRPGSGFTLLFEALALTLVAQMPVSAVARLMEVQDTRLWRLLQAYVQGALDERDMSEVSQVGVDETACRRGHDYVSLFVDLAVPAVLFVTPGKDASTFDRFAADLSRHGGRPADITDVALDMSAAFVAGATRTLPNAAITHDKFHIFKLVTDAVDETRREESSSHPELIGTRYVWLKNPLNLTPRQLETWDRLKDANLKTVKAYELWLAFREIWHMPLSDARGAVGRWISWALRSRVPAMAKVAQTLRRNVPNVLRVLETDLSTAILEGINSLVQAAKSRARGYRNVEYFITMIYVIAGKLALPVAHTK